MRLTPDSFAEYLKNYEESWQDLEEIAEELPDYEGRTLYSTWNLSLSQLNAEAVTLLRLMAYFSNQDIWFELLQKVARKGIQPSPFKFLSSQKKFGSIMRRLQDYSLVESHESAGAYSLHTCVHDWTLEYLKRSIDRELPWHAFHCVAESFV